MNIRVRSRSASGSWFLLLFALPFAGVGVFMAGLTVRTLAEAYQMSHWPETPARLLEARLEDHHGDDSTTWKATARYTYDVADQTYEGTRVGLHSGSDNIGRWQRTTGELLERKLRAGEPVACRYNPANPAESILFPQLRPSMLWFHALFAIVFGGVGIGLFVGTLYARRQKRQEQALTAEFPDQPWRTRPEWASGVIRAGGRSLPYIVLGFAFFWNAVTWTVLSGLMSQLRQQGPAALFMLLFPLVGVGLLVWAVHALLSARRYGGAELTLAHNPGVLGGRFAGAVRLPNAARGADRYTVTLRCLEVDRRGEHTSERVRWEDEQVLRSDALPLQDEGAIVPVLFGLPLDLPASLTPCPGGAVVWRLNVQAKQPGIDLNVNFDVPVFRTPDSRADFQLDRTPLKAYLLDQPVAERMQAEGVQVDEASGECVCDFPAGRFKGNAVALTLVSLLFAGISAILWQSSAPRFMAAIFSVMTVGIIGAALDGWFGSARVEADAHSLRWSKRGILGTRSGEIPAAEVKDVAAEMWAVVNNRQVYRLRIYTTAGRRLTLGRSLDSKSAGDLLAADLKRVLGKK